MKTAYEHGYDARLHGRFRVLANPTNTAEETAWLRGWDDADLLAPTSPTRPVALAQPAPAVQTPER